MWAYQVIEYLNKCINITSDQFESEEKKEKYIHQSLFCKEKIIEAQKFNFSNLNGFDEFYEKNYKENLFSEENIFKEQGNIKLPYRTCWFDYDNYGSKYGYLLLEREDNKDNFDIIMFTYYSKIKYSKADDYWTGRWHRRFLCYTKGINFLNNFDFKKTIESVRCDIDYDFVDEEFLDDETRLDRYHLFHLIYFLMFLNCKNIGTETIKPPERLNKKRIKNGKQKLFSYHTLVLKPTGKRQESIPKHLWDNRIHLCRGHFKTYTEEKPLFGRIIGRFWWQPIVRGKNKKGIVLKDYEVRDN